MLLERKKIGAAVAEWLRRQIRNLLGISRTGSNPVRSEFFYNKKYLKLNTEMI